MSSSTSLRLASVICNAASRRHLNLSDSRLPLLSRTYATPATYKPHEKDPQLGDYPDLPWVSNQEFPAKGWWDQQMRRNFGDPVSISPDFSAYCRLRPYAFFCRYKNTTKSSPCGAQIFLRCPHIRLCSSFLLRFRHSLVLVSCASMRLYQKGLPYPGNTRTLGLYVNLADLKKTRWVLLYVYSMGTI